MIRPLTKDERRAWQLGTEATNAKGFVSAEVLAMNRQRYEATLAQKDVQMAALVTAAQDALSAIKMLPAEILGTGVASDGSYSWPFRDELITKIEKAIKEATG